MKDGDMRHSTFKLWQFFRINKDDSFSVASSERMPYMGALVSWKIKQLAHLKGGRW